jgi:hypothetical protein
VYPPEVVAATIVRVLRRPRRVAYAGRLGHALAVQWRLAPALAERVLAWYGSWAPFDDRPAATSGNLFTAGTGPVRLDGGFRGRDRTTRRAAIGVGVAGATLGLAALTRGIGGRAARR